MPLFVCVVGVSPGLKHRTREKLTLSTRYRSLLFHPLRVAGEHSFELLPRRYSGREDKHTCKIFFESTTQTTPSNRSFPPISSFVQNERAISAVAKLSSANAPFE